jgi:hypothetical protein
MSAQPNDVTQRVQLIPRPKLIIDRSNLSNSHRYPTGSGPTDVVRHEDQTFINLTVVAVQDSFLAARGTRAISDYRRHAASCSLRKLIIAESIFVES